MKVSSRKLFVFFIVVFLVISACGMLAPNEPTQPPEAVQLPQPTTAVSVDEVVVTEAATPTQPEPTAAPSLSQEELIERWRGPVSVYTYLSGICQAAEETIGMVDGNTNESDILGAAFAIGIFMEGTETMLDGWIPDSDLAEDHENAAASLDTMSEMLEQWASGDMTAADAAAGFDTECIAIESRLDGLAQSADDEGLTEESLAAIITEMEEGMFAGETDVEYPSEDADDVSVPAEVGFSRQNPYPKGEMGTAPNWDVEVTEIIRGDEAWQMIYEANEYNDPAPEGMEYLLLNIHALNTSEEDAERSINGYDFGVTGSNLIKYENAFVFGIEPELSATLFPGGETEGWAAYLIQQGDTDLILILDELANWDDNRYRFYALDEGASISASPELKDIQPTGIGVSRSEPAEVGDLMVTTDWEITVLEVVSGEDAWQMILQADEYNDPAEAGMEYVLVRVLARYIGSSDIGDEIDAYFFKSTGSGNALNDAPYVIVPDPALDLYLMPGGTYEGWVTLVVGEDETGLLLVFQPWLDWDDENRRFISLE